MLFKGLVSYVILCIGNPFSRGKRIFVTYQIYYSILFLNWLNSTASKRILIWIVLLIMSNSMLAQNSVQSPGKPLPGPVFNNDLNPGQPDKQRIWLIVGLHAATWAGSYIALNEAWYADYPKEPFHFFNDNREWNQMDKAGHVWTTYQVSRFSSGLWKWARLNHRQSAWLGGISGVAYQSIIELQDGFSSEWGFSWGDMLANIGGAALFVSQELGWHEQRIQVKMSYWPYDYTTPELKARRNQLFGNGFAERILKDYNAQTYWLSANINSFFPSLKMPGWLNIAAGYNSDGLLGGFENTWTDKLGNDVDRTDIPRVRRFLLSADIDLTKIKTNSKFLKTVFSVVNMVKIPAPALELNSSGSFKVHAIYF